ncbi:MAG: GIY-YIG nuclease family protein [Saprospiraceae bacterium]|nr:GIY-YIG nuclease family protein [Saprospiraceae bacterium]
MEDQTYKVYIIHSETLGKYYIGYTSMTIEERISRHHCEHSGFTSSAKDLNLVHVVEYTDKNAAICKEKQIKKRGIKRYLDGLMLG